MAPKSTLLERIFSSEENAVHLRRHMLAKRVVEQSRRGRSLKHGFLHIPKTGGSALGDFVRNLEVEGETMPVRFSHFWRLADIATKFPKVKVSFMIRDPLERTVSGFNSRLRQGRPRNHSMWSTEEAASFSHFSSVQSFLDGMISDDDYQISAVEFAMKNIEHLRRNYEYYFDNLRTIKQNQQRIHLVGEVETSAKFWIRLVAEFGIPQATVMKNYKMAHVSRISTADIFKPYSEKQIERMRQALKSEYKIYNTLKKMVNC